MNPQATHSMRFAAAVRSMCQATVCLLLTVAATGAGPAGATGQTLPDNRAWERVTPVDINGVSPGSAVASVNGNGVMFQAKPFGDATTGGLNLYRSTLGSEGWTTTALTPKDVASTGHPLSETGPFFFTPDLTRAIFLTGQPFAVGDQDNGALDLYELNGDGTLSWLSQGTEGGTIEDNVTYDGASPDGSHVAFDTAESLLPAATGLDGNLNAEYLYERSTNTERTELINVNNSGTLLNPAGAILGNGTFLTISNNTYIAADYNGTTTHAISENGEKTFFESPSPEGEFALSRSHSHAVHLYMRKSGQVTVPLDDPEINNASGARYMGASTDGREVFFLSDEGLASDEFKDPELYVYNTDTEHLTAISTGPAGSPPVDGSVDGVTAIANDGSRVYYIAKGLLATNINAEGHSAIEGQPNLYVYDTTTGTNTFVTELGDLEAEPQPETPGRLDSYLDVTRLAVPTPTGEVLVFMSELNLTGEDSDGEPQVYRYDARTESLICVSCDPAAKGGSTLAISDEGGGTGAIGGGSYDPPKQSAPMSEDGNRIFFETEESLVPEDQNGNAPPSIIGLEGTILEVPNNIDVYEWESGHVYLISGGKTGATSLQSVSPSGNDVFFDTDVELLGQPFSGFTTLYDARVNGMPTAGAGSEEPRGACESPEACHGPPTAPPGLETPGSATLGGPGEALAPKVAGPTPRPPAPKPHRRKAKSRSKRKRRAVKHVRNKSKRDAKKGSVQ